MMTQPRPRHARPPRGARGFSAVEILVVLAVLGVLAGVGYAATGQYRARAAEAEMREDLMHFVNQQQALRQRTGALGSLEALREGGYRSSPGVVVEESRVEGAGRRAYLRVAHRKTGQRCSVDYSPFVSNADNRIQCWGGDDDPSATERAGTADVGGPTRVATTPVDTPAVDSTRVECSAVAATLTPPSDRADATLGSEYADAFTLFNPNATARTYTLAFSSSNPSVVPSVAGPGTVTVGPGATQSVAARYRVNAEAEAGQVAVVPLEATDQDCNGVSGNSFFSVIAPLRLGDLVVRAPGDVTVVPGAAIPARWVTSMQTNAPRMMVLENTFRGAGLTLNPTQALGAQAYQRGVEQATDLRYTLDPQVDGGTQRQACISFYDREYTSHRQEGCFTVTAEFIPRAPVLDVSGVPQDVGQGEQFTATWSVVNTSNAPRPFNITPAATGDLSVVASTGAGQGVLIARGASHLVRVTYRLRDTSIAETPSTGTLQVQDVDARFVPPSSAAREFSTKTRLQVCAPTVVSAPGDRTEKPGASIPAVWKLHNCTNAARTLSLTPAGNGDVVSVGDARAESFQPFEDRDITFAYRLNDRSVAGTVSRPSLAAADAGAAAEPSPFAVTTATVLCAPVLGAATGVAPQPQMPGTGATVRVPVTNCSNAARTFTTGITSSDPGVVPTPGTPAPLALDPYASGTMTFEYAVPARAIGNTSSDVSYHVSDADADGLAGDGAFRVTAAVITRAPRLDGFADQTVLPAQQGSSAALLTSLSNVPVTFCFEPTVSAGTRAPGEVVAGTPDAPACAEVAPYDTARVTQTFTLADSAQSPWTNQLAVRAYDRERPELTTTTGPFTVTAALVLADPMLVLPDAGRLLRQKGGTQEAREYVVTNLSNAPREICLTLTPAKSVLVPVETLPLCTTIAAWKEYTFQHTMSAGSVNERVSVTARAYDALVPEHFAEGRFVIQIKYAGPTAYFVRPTSVYYRRWITFDASQSSAGDGGKIVKYIWTWGLDAVRWDASTARFTWVGGLDEIPEEVTDAVIQRAYDTGGPYWVCLVVEDESGQRSDKDCDQITPRPPTRARVAWKYRGWWTHQDFCIDVWWDNQCTPEHGNSRWEIDLHPSQGSSPIVEANATVTVRLHNTDNEKNSETVTYRGNRETIARRDYTFRDNRFAAGGSAQSGKWRVLNTAEPSAEGWYTPGKVVDDPLVMNINLAKATGLFDGGPHWVPDWVVITLEVVDADNIRTSSTLRRDHIKKEWDVGYVQAPAGESGPSASVSIETITQDTTYRATGQGFSPEGRIVDSWWEVYAESLGDPSSSTYRGKYRGKFVDLEPAECEVLTAVLVVKDDHGIQASAGASVSGAGDWQTCNPGGVGGTDNPRQPAVNGGYN